MTHEVAEDPVHGATNCRRAYAVSSPGNAGRWEMREPIGMQVTTGKIMTPSGDATRSSVEGMQNEGEGCKVWGTG